ncbi:OmpA family protein [Streptobacillus canis]|uniref:OmpA family protein n=1 Tax=Streptobacillus canis TaxID=2678686 RepID=UPI0012E32C59|nr:OmpA family protein [Streptobacillus canis]
MKNTTSGVASAIAHANIPTNNVNKTHTIGASMGYYEKDWAFSIGYSGMEKNIGFKVTGALNSSLKPSVGAGISYTFGDMNVKENGLDKVTEKISENNNLDIIYNSLKQKDADIKRILFEISNMKLDINGLKKDFNNLKDSIKVYDDTELRNQLLKLKEKVSNLSNQNIETKKSLENVKYIEEKSTVQKLVLTDFDFNKYNLSKMNIEKLKKFFLEIEGYNEIVIVGNTDKVGTYKYNLGLSEKRAKAVYDFIINNFSVDRNKIYYFGQATRNLVSKNDSTNRRVEIIIK